MFKAVSSHIIRSRKNTKSAEIAFLAAVVLGNLDQLEQLLKAGVNPNVRTEDGHTALHIAAEKDYFLAGKLLLQAKGIDKNCTTPSGDTALMVAIRADAMNFVRLLLKYGADVNKANHFGRTPLHLASYQKSLEMITGLLLHRANPNVEDAFGNTPLCWCMLESPDVQVARRLLKWGANPDFRTIKPYPLLLELALNCKCEGDIAMIDILLEFEADINIRGEVSKFTALHVASITGYLPLAKFLLQNGSQIDSVDVTKRSPLDVATDHGHTELVAFYRSRLFEIERRARIVATASSLKRKSAADTQLSKTVTFDRLL